MSNNPLRVGLIGASPDFGWARNTHLPALKALDDITLSAVGTSRLETAQLSARIFGVANSFSDAAALAAHPEVDIVAISTPVGTHDSLIRAVLPTRKPIYCEWPLASTTERAVAVAAEVKAAGVRNAIGLQGRVTPSLAYAREIIASGAIGRLLAVTVYASLGQGAAGVWTKWGHHHLDPDYGATLLSIYAGHVTDNIEAMTGGIELLGAHVRTVQSMVRYVDTVDEFPLRVPDNILVHGTVAGGGGFSAHITNSKNNGSRVTIEISGTGGDLRLESSMPGIQVAPLRLSAAFGIGGPLQPLAIPGHLRRAPATIPDMAMNVAELYSRFATDLRTGSATVPNFDDAVRLHHIIDHLRRSAADNGIERPVEA